MLRQNRARIDELFRQLSTTDQDSPEAQAIHDELLPLLTRPKPYTTNDLIADLRDEITLRGADIDVAYTLPSMHGITVITRRGDLRLPFELTTRWICKAKVSAIVDQILEGWEESSQSRNSEALKSFIAYCESHPEQRFWQALRNWSKYHTIYGFNGDTYRLQDVIREDGLIELHDTFFIEGLGGTR